MAKQFSTKDQEVITATDSTKTGVARFHFTDDYSVFHFSKMPDKIPLKGEAICRMGAFSLGLVEKAGIRTHLLRSIGPKTFELSLLRVLYPQNNEIHEGERNYVLPLQIVCRNYLPEGASVFRRLKEGKTTLAQLGFTKMPVPGEKLEHPMVEFMSKREEIDRFITDEEARVMSCLTHEQFAEVRRVTLEVNRVITAHAESVGLTHADSKIELGIDSEGRVIVVDTTGTPDENRFLLDGFHVTKQVLRNFYLVRGLEKQVQDWVAAGVPRAEWPKPQALPEEYPAVMSQLYTAMCERWTHERIFGAPKLETVVESMRALETKWVHGMQKVAV